MATVRYPHRSSERLLQRRAAVGLFFYLIAMYAALDKEHTSSIT
jgi:hypothetical protein